MIFAIYCIDKPTARELRLKEMEAHREYVMGGPIRIIVAGPLLADDGKTSIGSFFIVEAENRAEVEAFQEKDPYYRAGVWESVLVRAAKITVDNRD